MNMAIFPPIDQNGPLSQWVRVGTTNIVIPTEAHSPTSPVSPIWSSVPLGASRGKLCWLKHFICRAKRQGEMVSGTDHRAATMQSNKQTNLPHYAKTKRFFINLSCNVPVGKWIGMERVSGCSGKATQGNKTTTTRTYQHAGGPSSFPIQCFDLRSCNKSVWEGWGRIERQAEQPNCLPKNWPGCGGCHVAMWLGFVVCLPGACTQGRANPWWSKLPKAARKNSTSSVQSAPACWLMVQTCRGHVKLLPAMYKAHRSGRFKKCVESVRKEYRYV